MQIIAIRPNVFSSGPWCPGHIGRDMPQRPAFATDDKGGSSQIEVEKASAVRYLAAQRDSPPNQHNLSP